MIDMGQADRTLRTQHSPQPNKMAWTFALYKASKEMGYNHFMDVPDSEAEQLKATARAIRQSSCS